ncbi:MAG: hypothetical protein QOF58_1396 [Pseudonocardiales bacterium]|nr:hypothetical protein [Pseudonocardiales bacterium]
MAPTGPNTAARTLGSAAWTSGRSSTESSTDRHSGTRLAAKQPLKVATSSVASSPDVTRERISCRQPRVLRGSGPIAVSGGVECHDREPGGAPWAA